MKMVRKVKNKLGKVIEVLCDPADPAPVELSPDIKPPESQDQRIRRIIAEQIRPQDHGYETEEEANDLDIEDDDMFAEMPLTPAEADYLKSKHADLIEELLKPHKAQQREEVKADDREDAQNDPGTRDPVPNSEVQKVEKSD